MTSTRIVSVPVRLKRGKKITVPDVAVDECDRCGDRIFDAVALRKIEDYQQCTGRLLLRLEPTMHAQLLRHSQRAHRSLNQQIVHYIAQGLKKGA